MQPSSKVRQLSTSHWSQTFMKHYKFSPFHHAHLSLSQTKISLPPIFPMGTFFFFQDDPFSWLLSPSSRTLTVMVCRGFMSFPHSSQNQVCVISFVQTDKVARMWVYSNGSNWSLGNGSRKYLGSSKVQLWMHWPSSKLPCSQAPAHRLHTSIGEHLPVPKPIFLD